MNSPKGNSVVFRDWNVRHHTLVEPLSPSEGKIIRLCGRAVEMQNSEDFEPAMVELRAAIHEHLAELRQTVASLRVMITSREELEPVA